MAKENGEWIIRGLALSDPDCIKTVEQLVDYINEVGFLPLFKNDIPGFSVEEHTAANGWWCGDAKTDPWEWRGIIAAAGDIAYGKFFDKKAGFISKAWLPTFVNYRRDGYDFDSRWDDEKASHRQKKIMDIFDSDTEMLSNELKEKAGFGKGGEKNFEGTITALQMEMYLCVREFRQRTNKKGEPYGWAIAVYSRPEHLWGYEYVSGMYSESPEVSRERILAHMRKLYSGVTEKQLALL